jgi:acetate kinase
MNNEQIIEFLKGKVELFNDFSSDVINDILKGSRTVAYEPNEAVIRYGEDAAFLGVILEGELTASVLTDGDKRQDLGLIKAGEVIGEMSLMTGRENRNADVIAITSCQVLQVPVSLFKSVIMTEPRAVQHISSIITDRYQEMMSDPAKAAAAFHKSEDPYGLRLKGERPEKIIILNCRSSEIKFHFFDTENDAQFARGIIERIGEKSASLTYSSAKGTLTKELPQIDYRGAFEALIHELLDAETGVIKSLSKISVVGHRVVHGGERFTEALLIDDKVLKEIESLTPVAPLHIPTNVAGIKEARHFFPTVPHIAVFDTAFHQTMPMHAFLYGLPYEYYEQKHIRRYGFHGMSHANACMRTGQYLNRYFNELRIVSCHLGRGSSLAAVDHGRSIDTTMGFTPLEGLIMETRCGDLDPGIVTYLERTEGLSSSQVDELLNTKSGLLGISGVSNDMREVEKAAESGNRRAMLAVRAYCYRIRKQIGAYAAAMGGLDAVVFTGGIGQGSAGVRSLALQSLAYMGLLLDEQRNREARGVEEVCRISADNSPVTALVVPTNEARMIARETLRALSRSYITRVLETQKQEPIPIEISAHHVHLTQEHVEALFGKGHQLTWHSDLSQPGQFACKEQVTLVGPKGRIERVRVLGPARKTTQVEIAMTEQFKLGIHPPVRESGDLTGTPGCTLEGPESSITIDKGVICALRHIHMTPEDALRYGVKDKSVVRVRVSGVRELVFGDVVVRVDQNFKLAMHLDTDEGNAANLETGTPGYIDCIQDQD